MRCLRAKTDLNDEAFCKFFQLVQNEAIKRGALFFPECGEGNEGKVDGISCEDLTGWLIPNNLVTKFEPLFMSWSEKVNDDEWDKFCVAEEWSKNNEGELTITFRDLFPYIEMCRKDNF